MNGGQTDVLKCPECGELNSVDEDWGNHVYQFHPDIVEKHINENPWVFYESIRTQNKQQRGTLGSHPEKQLSAVRVLLEDGPLTYAELETRVHRRTGITHDEMQAVMRGLNQNGLVKRVNRDGRRLLQVPTCETRKTSATDS